MTDDAAALRVHLSEAIAAADPTLHDRMRTDPDAYLGLVALTAQARAETDVLLRLAVAGARAAGCTWEAIGGRLGMTRQAAQQRYGEPTASDGAAESPAAGPVEHPPGRVHRIRYLNSFTEMAALERAARYGWRLVGAGSGTVIVRKTDVQWEHQRLFASRAAGRALVADGWEKVGDSWFPWAYYARPTGLPAAPEPADDDYLQRTDGA